MGCRRHEADRSAIYVLEAATHAELGGRIATEALGSVAFRGKALPVKVFSVPCSAAMRSSPPA